VLGPAEYGRFAVASMISIVLSTALFDWLRLSATRHYNEANRESDPALRASLNAVYLGSALLVAGGAVVVIVLGIDVRLTAALLLATAAASIANGQFEFWAALARARFLDMTYAKLVVIKNTIALILMVGAGLAFHSATWVLGALTPSIAIAILAVWRRLHDSKARIALARRERIVGFAQYGFPIVTANVIYQIIVLVNRWVAASKFGYADAGQLSLATDLSIRLLLAVGAGFDVLLFQLAVRREMTHGRTAAQGQIADNMLLIAAVLIPLAAGYATTLPSFVAVFVPVQYRGSFAEISLILIPGIVAFCFTQFAFGPVFQLTGRTRPLAFAAAAGLATDLLLLTLLPRNAGTTGFAVVHSVSLVVACAVAAAMALRLRECRPPLRDVVAILIATGAMTLAVWPTRTIDPPWLAFVSAVAIGVPVYAVLGMTFDIAGLRNMIKLRLGVVKRVPSDEPSQGTGPA
jgi:O-antigen/teichoic acid export membrane protein